MSNTPKLLSRKVVMCSPNVLKVISHHHSARSDSFLLLFSD
jgi:hypothetical protein